MQVDHQRGQHEAEPNKQQAQHQIPARDEWSINVLSPLAFRIAAVLSRRSDHGQQRWETNKLSKIQGPDKYAEQNISNMVS